MSLPKPDEVPFDFKPNPPPLLRIAACLTAFEWCSVGDLLLGNDMFRGLAPVPTRAAGMGATEMSAPGPGGHHSSR